MSTSKQQALPYDIEVAPLCVQKHYLAMLADGVGEKFAEMCALQSPPSTSGTDRTFMEGRCNNQQFDGMPKDHALRMIDQAKSVGVNPSGKYYCSGLADKRGARDPKAWVDGVGDIQRIAEERNLSVDGAVKKKGRAVPRPESKPLSEKLTSEMMKVESRRNPSMNKGELREMVIDKYERKKKK